MSALLMAWSLIGIELESTPIENFKVTIKSPQAAPYVLIVLVIYFLFRTTVEWFQIDARRRSLLVSRIDFWVAHSIAGAALTLFGIQELLKVQVANVVGLGWDDAVAYIAGGNITIAGALILRPSLRKRFEVSLLIPLVVLASGVCLVFVSVRSVQMLIPLGVGCVAVIPFLKFVPILIKIAKDRAAKQV